MPENPPVAAVLSHSFRQLAREHGADEQLIAECWRELAAAYEGAGRHYHNLAHLAAMLAELAPFQQRARDWVGLRFAVFYHDAVYEVPGARNEELSAELAQRRLPALGVPAATVARCAALIRATQHHAPSGDFDTDVLLDADLAVLGRPWPTYARHYAAAIRREYAVYPDEVYQPGRRAVLTSLLARPRLFQTPEFYARYEMQARENLTRELAGL